MAKISRHWLNNIQRIQVLKKKGGELSEFGPGMMVKEFEDAAYKLEVGQLSEPVKSSFGYHIIKLTDKKSLNRMRKRREYS